MDYKKWAGEYKSDIEILKEKISLLQNERKKAITLKTKQEAERRLYILQGMYIDCKHTYEILSRRAANEIYSHR